MFLIYILCLILEKKSICNNMELNNTLAIDFFDYLNETMPIDKVIDKTILNIDLQPFSIGKNYPNGDLNENILQLFSKSFVDSKIVFSSNYSKMIDDTLNKKIHFKFSPLINLDLLLNGRYKNDAELMKNKMECSLNASHLETCFAILSNTLQNYGNGFCHLVKYYGGGRVFKKQFRHDVGDCIDLLTQTEHFMNGVKKKEFVFVSNERIPSPLLFNDFSKKYSVENYDEEFNFDELDDVSNGDVSNDDVLNDDVLNDDVLNDDNICNINNEDEWNVDNQLNSDEELEGGEMEEENDTETNKTETENEDDTEETETETENDETETDNEDNTEETETETEDDTDNELWDLEEEIQENYKPLEIVIKNIPCEIIAQEHLTDTLENFIKNSPEFKQNPDDVGASLLMQIIAILITYYKAFHFVHNDLHTDNIMYVKTNKTHIYYIIDGKTYCIPTHGYIFKIIDFARCCFEYQGQRYISDHFFPNEEAEAQYNCEPFYDPTQPRIDPNPSFDLCYLAFWIFQQENMKLNKPKNEFQKIILEWCKDDKQKNIVVDKYGNLRFDGFDLYEHIAKNVHNHIPLQQLDKPFFKQFLQMKNISPNINDENIEIVNVDAIPCFV